MDINTIMLILITLVLTICVWRAIQIVQREKDNPIRGSDRRTGHHIIHSEYSSGISGHQTTYRVPCDPDEYAKIFVPQQTDTKK